MSKYNLDKKDIDIKTLAKKAPTDEKLLRELMDGIQSKDITIRSNSFNILLKISEENPEFLYPKWDYFKDMLMNANNYYKYIAIYILANLARVNNENKFDKIFYGYYGILEGDKIMNASHVVLNSSKIALYKPELQNMIIDKLLNTDNIHQGRHKELLKAYVIESLQKMYPKLEDKEKILKFIKEQAESSSPKTRDLVACFLDRCS